MVLPFLTSYGIRPRVLRYDAALWCCLTVTPYGATLCAALQCYATMSPNRSRLQRRSFAGLYGAALKCRPTVPPYGHDNDSFSEKCLADRPTNYSNYWFKAAESWDALRRSLNLHKEQKKTTNEVQEFWVQAQTPTIAETSISRKVLAFFNEWKLLGKSKGSPGSAPNLKQKAFGERLPDLFDCAHAEALTPKMIDEDKEFLLAEREKRRCGSMARLDKKIKKAVCRCEKAADLSIKKGTKTVLSSNLVVTLDRTSVSSRLAFWIVAAPASTLGHDPKGLILNPNSSKEIKQSGPQHPLTVHWDGKILPQDYGSRGDRLAILITKQGEEKLLAARQPIESSEAAATSVYEALEDWACVIKSWRCA
ncbi:hypothetical protein O3P69_008905 [Scylla paramamosain]|uniref:Uncharacterized protein n=1 Tax=Scylla paramamosain TaxID=85552 RepID=A0AAW0TS72_SCYPA